jgi:hypothetical protein
MRRNKGSGKQVRVTIQQGDGEDVIMKIEGKVAGVHVQELQRAWEHLALTLGQRKLLVDLRGVLHIDAPARDLLAEIHAKTGPEYLADTPLTKYFAEQARQAVRKSSSLAK